MTLKELAAALTRLAEVDPHAEVYFEKHGSPELTRVCYVAKRDRSGRVSAQPSKGSYVVIGQ